MKKLAVAAAFIFAFAAGVFAGPYDSWTRYRTVSVNTTNTGGGANVTTATADFPLLVRLTNTSSATGKDVLDSALANGADVRFTDATGATALSFQIERWSASAAEIWVRVPSVAGNATTSIRMYWGKSGATTTSSGSAVFDTTVGFRGVYHLGESASPSSDATVFATNATWQNSPTTATGIIGSGIRLANASGVTGSNGKYLTAAYANRNWITTKTKGMTISAWVNLATNNGLGDQGIAGRYNWSSNHRMALIEATSATAPVAKVGFSPTGSGTESKVGTQGLTVGTWYHVAATVKEGSQIIYVNGVANASATTTGLIMLDSAWSDSPLSIGHMNPAQTGAAQVMDGTVDEVTFSATTRSADFIKLSYETQKAATGAVTLGNSVVQGVLSFTTKTASYTVGSTITPVTPTVSGTLSSITSNPALPAGLSINQTTGVLSGTPTVVSTQTNYVLTATFSSPAGSISDTLKLTILPVAPTGLSHTVKSVNYPVNQTITANTATVTAAVVDSFTVSPALPTGLSINKTNGTISGTPTVATASANYVVTAQNAGGNSKDTLTLAVLDVPAITYASSTVTYTAGVPGASNLATVPSTRSVTGSYSVSPALPAGLSLDTATGTISGTPSSSSSAADYVVSATNVAGTGTATVNIKVLASEDYTGGSWPGMKTFSLNTTAKTAAAATGTALAEVTRIPVLVRLGTAHAAIFNTANSDGSDIRFSKPDGTRLPYEIEQWDKTAKSAAIWVLLDTAKTNTLNSIRMHYGNSLAASKSEGGAVFDRVNGFVGSWHMGNSTAMNPRPSSVLGAPSAIMRNYTGGNTAVTGVIGLADTLRGGNGGANADPTAGNYIDLGRTAGNVGNDYSGFSDFTTGFSYSLWFNQAATVGNIRLLAMGADSSSAQGVASASRMMILGSNNGSDVTLRWVADANPSGLPTTYISNNVWTHLFLTKAAGTGSVNFYKNGSLFATATNLSDPGNVLRNWVMIGRSLGGGNSFYQGKIDNLTLSKTQRSADFVRLSYNTQKAASLPVSDLTYLNSNPSYVRSKAITTNTATVLGTATKFRISPSLPQGLSMDSTTGTVSGTPTVASSSQPYTITAYNDSAWATTAVLNLSVITQASDTVRTVAATPGNQQATVTWTAPAFDGGTAITSYTATAVEDNSKSCTIAFPTLTCTVTGLTNGSSYTFTVTATNGAGTSAASNASAAVTPRTVPDAPTGVSGVYGNQLVSVSWTAPAFNGGSAITSYKAMAVSDTSKFCTATFPTSTCDVTGLSNGTSYAFQVRALNIAGAGNTSVASSPAVPRTLAGAPTDVAVTPGDQQVTVSWTPPASNGGSAISGYTATAVEDTSLHCTTVDGSTLECVVPGLTNGNAYTFTVIATNDVGSSSVSVASPAAIPASGPSLPGVPLAVAAVPGNVKATVSWSAPSSNGGSAITSYKVMAVSDTTLACVTPDGATLTCDVTGLTNGTSYTFRVHATNGVGTSAASAAVAVTPRTVPDAPSSAAGVAGNQVVTVSWSAPAFNGGSSITGYTATAVEDTSKHCATAALFCDISSLTNGSPYTFTVTATNLAGTGAASAASFSVTPRTVPDAPTAVTGTADSAKVTVSWSAPAFNGGSSITAYKVLVVSDTTKSCTTSGATSCLVSGLTNGTAYTFQVRATNVAGPGALSVASSNVTPSPYAAWSSSRSIVLNTSATGANVPGDVVNFPVLVRLGSAEASIFSQAKSGGADIRFAKSNGLTVLPYEIESWNGSTAAIWVKVDSVKGNNSTQSIKMYWNNSSALSGSNPNAVFDTVNGFVGAWHLGNASGSSSRPSAVLGAPPAVIRNPVGGYQASSGVIGLSDSLPGGTAVNDGNGSETGTKPYIDLGRTGYTGYSNFTTGVSYSVWINPNTLLGSFERFLQITTDTINANQSGGSASTRIVFLRHTNLGGSLAMRTSTITTGNSSTSFTPNPGAWRHLAFSKGPGTDSVIIYVDGTRFYAYAPVVDVSNTLRNYAWIGRSYDATNAYLNAKVDEPVLSKVPRSANWMRLSYQNQRAANTLTDIGLPVVPDAPNTVTGVPANASAVISWSAPASNGGADVNYYTVTASPGGATCTTLGANAGATSCTVTGLTNGSSYTFTVTATNDVGTGSASAASDAVIPRTVPGAPSAPIGVAGTAQVSVSWTASVANGGSSITGYKVLAVSDTTKSCMTSDSTTVNCTVTGLTNATAYRFVVKALNVAGASAASDTSVAVTPRTVPDVPTSVTGIAGIGQVAVSWVAPVFNGGSAVTGYTAAAVEDTSRKCTVAAPALTCTITGLTNASPYTFTVAATNVAGTGLASTPSASVTPRRSPDAPTNVAGLAGAAKVTVSWTAPAFNGGSSITSYTVIAIEDTSRHCTTPNGSTVTCDVTGLTNGTPYTFKVVARNVAGSGDSSDASASVTPRTLSGAPTAVSGAFGNTKVTVSWTAPLFNGGSAITSYTAVAVEDTSKHCTTSDGSTLTCDVTGLTNGTPYTFKVVAANVAGTGDSSAASSSVIPRTVPGIPTGIGVTPGNEQVIVSWSAPANGGSAITGYKAAAVEDDSKFCTTPDETTLECTVTGLTNGEVYTFTVQAINGVGAGSSSPVSSTATPTPAAVAPGAPLSVTGVAGNGLVAVSWQLPSFDGGAAITSYIARANPDTLKTCESTAPARTCTISGLANGTAYTFTVRAINTVDTGVASGASASVTPRTVPDAPTGAQGVPGNSKVTVSWTAPAFNGGSAITSYTATMVGDTTKSCTTADGVTLACDVTGLTNGSIYSFTVIATNVAGSGAASVASDADTARTVPDAPTAALSVAGDTKVTVSWTAPSYDGGAPILNYKATAVGDSLKFCATANSSTLTCDITGLTNGTAYTFTVKALNVAGASVASPATPSAVPRALPGAPTAVTGVPGNTKVTVSWTAPASNGGSAITSYTATAVSDSTKFCTTANGSTVTCDVTGLTNGTAYTFTVTATNVAGTGAASTASASVTPRTVPDAPTAVTGIADSGKVTLSWTVPASNGGSSITGYKAMVVSDTTKNCTTSGATTCAMTGLTNGTAYTFYVRASNIAGSSVTSSASSSVTPMPYALWTGSRTITLNTTASGANIPGDVLNFPVLVRLGSAEASIFSQAKAGGADVRFTKSNGFTVLPYEIDSWTGSTAAIWVRVDTVKANTNLQSIKMYWNNSAATSQSKSSAVFDTTYGFRAVFHLNEASGNISNSTVDTLPGVNSGTTTTTGNISAGRNFGGANPANNAFSQYIDLGNPSRLNFAPKLTISAWVRWLNVVGNGSYYRTIVQREGSTPSAETFLRIGYGAGNSVSLSNYAGGKYTGPTDIFAQSAQTPSVYADSAKWIHLATTYDSTSTTSRLWKLYRNGVLVGTSTDNAQAGVTTGATKWWLGRTTSQSNRNYSGDLDEVRITATTQDSNYIKLSYQNQRAAGKLTDIGVPKVPGAPTAVTGIPGNASVAVSWTAPASDSGAVIFGYTVTAAPGGANCTTVGATSCTVSGLTNSTSYTFTVTATNDVGTGSASVASSALVPFTVPNAPTAAAGVAGVSQVTVSWTAPASNGGSAVTGYTATAVEDGTKSCTTPDGSTLSCTVTGLTNGTAYTFTVKASNIAGAGSASTASSAVTPRTVPGAPTAITGNAGVGKVTVLWTAPSSNGGSAITSYTATAVSDTSKKCTTPNGSTLTCDVTGLTNATSYTFTVTATNVAGSGAASVASASVTPRTVPDVPTAASGAAGNAQVTVSWAAPAFNGGSAVTSYKAMAASDTTKSCSVASPTLTCDVTGLSNGTAYRFVIRALNVAGGGALSDTSAAVTPRTVPSASTGVSGTPGNGQVIVSWTAPFNGGTPITAYTAITVQDTTKKCVTADGTALECTITGLTNDTAYTFIVKATNAIGTGAASSASASIMPTLGVVPPGAPLAVGATPGNQQVILAWSAPSADGGAAVSSYTARSVEDNTKFCTTSGLTCTVATLANGTAYTFTVRAANIAGTGVASAVTSAVTPRTIPDVPTAVTGTRGDSKVTVAWTASASTGGSAITAYKATAVEDTSKNCSTTLLTCDVTGLTNGTSYTFTVAAINVAGSSAASTASAAVVPLALPGAPNSLAVIPDSAKVTLSWSAPASNGGSAITGYKAMAVSDTTKSCTTSGATFCLISGLTNGTAYAFQVRATTVAGSTLSTASSSVTPLPYALWSNSRTITLNTAPSGANVTSDVLNFPVLVRLGSAEASIFSQAKSDGADLRFTKSNGTSVLPYEIESWTGSSAAIWVKMDTVKGNNSSQSIRMYWNNSGATAASSSNAVFDTANGFVGAWHLGNASGSSSRPSSVLGAPPAVIRNPVGGYQASSGLIGLSDSLPGGTAVNAGDGSETGTKPYIDVGRTGYAGYSNFATGVSYSVWINPNVPLNSFERFFQLTTDTIVGNQSGSVANTRLVFLRHTTNNGSLAIRTNGIASGNSAAFIPNPGTWKHLAFSKAAGTDSVIIYVDGARFYAYAPVADVSNTLRNYAWIGRSYDAANGYLNAKVDEPVLSKVPRSASWMRLSYQNQRAANTLTDIGLPTLPGAPTGVTAVAGNASATVSWNAPASNGGADVNGYTVTASPGGATCTTFGSNAGMTSCTVSGLVNTTSYTFSVAATNDVGNSSASASSASVTPVGPPVAPTAVSGTAGNAQVTVSWTAPASNGGAAITSYTVRTVEDTLKTCTTPDGTTLACTVTGLANGTAYTFTVTAANVAGAGTVSTASAAVTPRTVPGAPTAVSGASGNGQVTVSWTAPASNGGSAVTGYTVTASPGGATCAWTTGALSCVVAGLTNGTGYTFTVTAANVAGTSAPSAASASVTPASAPGVPTSVSGVSGNAQVTVSWTAPASNGGAAISGYTVTASPGSATCAWTTGPLSCVVAGLTNGTGYTFTVTSINSAGTSSASSASASVTPASAPGAPTAVTGLSSSAQVIVSWTAPSSNGGAVITGYTVTASPGGATCSWTSGPLSCVVTGLNNGTAYTFTATATNAAGTSASSPASSSVTPATTPGVPTSVTGTPGNAQVTVSWTAPASNGGAAVTGYTVTASPGGATCAWTSGPLSCVVSPLANGTAYAFTVTAANAVGTSSSSVASSSVTPATLPGAPASVSGATGNALVTVSWAAPASNGGAVITGYTVTASPGGATCGWTTGPLSCAVTGLTNGTPYIFAVTATNAIGTGTPSAASAAVTPRTVPGAPSSVSAASGNGQATVSWTAPASNGGATITSYTVTASPGNATCVWTSGPLACTVTGLTNGTAYTFTVMATNAAGTSLASAPSSLITLSTPPSAPTSVTGTSGNGQVTVSWAAPASNGGSTITGYTATASPGGATCSWTTGPLSCIVTGLNNGAPYTFTVTATNLAGTGLASTASVPLTPLAPVGSPDAPTAVTGIAGNGQVTVSWAAPASDGGSAITGYTVTATPGGSTCSWTTGPLSCVVTGPINGTGYTFTVTATNSAGTSAASAASAPVTPRTIPGSPTAVTGVSGNAQVTVSWTAPASNGGSVITAYTVTASPGGATCSWTTGPLSCVVTGLANGTAYTFTVTAANVVGTGSSSTASAAVTPASAPASPTAVSGILGNAQVTISWTAPSSNGGAAITGYTVTASPGGATCSWTTGPLSCVVTGLTNGTAYTFTATATNTAGTGSPSAASSSVIPATVPGAPTTVAGVSGNAQVTVSWTAPASNGGAAITGYTVTASPGGATCSWTTGPLSCVVTGLTNGAAYTFTAKATNSAGTSLASSVSASVTPISPVSLSYSPSAFVDTVGIATSHGATVTGTVTSCVVTGTPAALPAGIVLNNTTCAITGTPTASASSATYTVLASNGSGTSTASLTLTVLIAKPTVAFTPSTLVDTVGVAATHTPVTTGTITGCVISPTIPGLSVNATTCAITGTPTASASASNFTVTASNATGSASATLSVAVVISKPTIVFTPATVVDTVGTLAAHTPATTGVITGCVMVPAIPGLSVNATTCAITGTPTAAASASNFTVTASNSTGSASATLSVAVVISKPTIVFTPATVVDTVGTLATHTPATTGTITGCVISPTIPGLSVNATTCAITGTPTAAASASNFTVTASNSSGSASTTLSVAVLISKPTVAFTPSTLVDTVGVTATHTPATTGTITGCVISPTIPGLSVNATTCAITGTPTAAASASNFTVTASNSTGSASTTLSVAVLISKPTIVFTPATVVDTVGTLATHTPATTGTITGCVISPTIPGLSVNATTCAITGTPTAAASASNFTVTASNSTGSASTTLSVAVLISKPTIVFTPATVVDTVGKLATHTPVTTGAITGCVMTPAIPGLTVNATTCAITGTPTAAASASNFTVTASNATGNASTTLSVAVLISKPTIVFTPATVVDTVGKLATHTPVTTGSITACTISPAVPGVTINATTCALTGTPTGAITATNLTVTASNSTGSASATLSVTILIAAPTNLAYAPDSMTLMKDSLSAPWTPTVTGTVTTWSVSPALPAGLALNPSTGAITGTPTQTEGSTGSYTVTAANSTGSTTQVIKITISVPVAILPDAFVIRVNGQDRPYAFQLPAGTTTERLTLSIVDAWGRTIWAQTVNPVKDRVREVSWNGRSANGRVASAGMYIVRISVLNGGKTTNYTRRSVTLRPR